MYESGFGSQDCDKSSEFIKKNKIRFLIIGGEKRGRAEFGGRKIYVIYLGTKFFVDVNKCQPFR